VCFTCYASTVTTLAEKARGPGREKSLRKSREPRKVARGFRESEKVSLSFRKSFSKKLAEAPKLAPGLRVAIIKCPESSENSRTRKKLEKFIRKVFSRFTIEPQKPSQNSTSSSDSHTNQLIRLTTKLHLGSERTRVSAQK
jgi:hypothetical protein